MWTYFSFYCQVTKHSACAELCMNFARGVVCEGNHDHMSPDMDKFQHLRKQVTTALERVNNQHKAPLRVLEAYSLQPWRIHRPSNQNKASRGVLPVRCWQPCAGRNCGDHRLQDEDRTRTEGQRKPEGVVWKKRKIPSWILCYSPGKHRKHFNCTFSFPFTCLLLVNALKGLCHHATAHPSVHRLLKSLGQTLFNRHCDSSLDISAIIRSSGTFSVMNSRDHADICAVTSLLSCSRRFCILQPEIPWKAATF